MRHGAVHYGPMTACGTLPAAPGTYLLVLDAVRAGEVRVGRLGLLEVRPGWYLYVGSAQGPGGLAARVAHHLSPPRRPHWHLDHVRGLLRPRELWYTVDGRRREDLWADVAAAWPGVRVPLPGFGASDRPGRTHLFQVPAQPGFRAFVARVHRRRPGHPPLRRLELAAVRRH